MENIKIKLNHPNAVLPTRGSKYAVGYDLYSCEELIIGKNNSALVDTGIILDIDLDIHNEFNSLYARIAPRSGISYKKKTTVGAGVIDPDYRGNIKILIFNHNNEEALHIQKGDKIAQLIFEKVYTPKIFKIENNEVSETDRGLIGFGSTG